jgi:hypothetical protein
LHAMLRPVAGLEVAVISLGVAVVKSAAKVWLGDRQFAGDVTSELVDLFAGRVSSRFDQRKIGRFFDDCTDIVARRLVTLLDVEFGRVPSHEREAAVLAVRDTFAAASLSDETLFQADLDARLVERQLRPAGRMVLRNALLSEGGEEIYWLVLRECCAYLVEVVTTLPKFSSGALTELLRRETAVLDTLSRVLDRLPERRGVDDFAADYRRTVVNKLDRMELLGVTLADANRRYPLSIAYIDLTVLKRASKEDSRLVIRGGQEAGDPLAAAGGLRPESVLGRTRRALVIGNAGSGKTTLLQWLAVRSALEDFGGSLNGWNITVPFFIPLRRYVNGTLPAPEEFPLAVGRNVAHEMPDGWVHGLLRDGRALVLLDGVDEMPEGQREHVRSWLGGLIGDFPDARYVVTSRPTAIAEGWLESLGFAASELQPMSTTDVTEFIRQWHKAMAAEVVDADEAGELARYEQSLLTAIDGDRHLRALTVSPLLCALVCALNRERRTQLPRDRMEIYEAALDMLLERRDRERGVELAASPLTRTEKLLLLQDIAFWLIRNGWSDASADRVVGQVARSLQHLHQVSAEPPEVFRDLMERSGLLREPAAGRVDFVHRTFQEYLAAKAAVDNDEIGQLVANAHDDQWREVVVMAAAHAQQDQSAELLRGLLKRARRRAYTARIGPLAVACMQTARRLDPQLRADIERLAERLVPPETNEAAESLAGAGELLLDLLRANPPQTLREAGASVRAASRIGGPSALRLVGDILAGHVRSSRSAVDDEVIGAWRLFKPEQYVAEVLARSWPAEKELRVPDPAFLDALQLFPGLRAIRCELRGTTGTALSSFGPGRELRSVTFTGCRDDLDLSPLLGLPALEKVSLSARGELPGLAVLSAVPREWTLTLESPTCADRLPELTGLGTLTALHLRGCDDLRDLGTLPARPTALTALSLYGFPNLARLDGIERWEGLVTVEFFDCPRITSFAPLRSLTSLESVSLGLLGEVPRDLSPLANLPRLRELTLHGHSEFDVNSLAGARDLVVVVPPRAKVAGADRLGPASRVAEFAGSP